MTSLLYAVDRVGMFQENSEFLTTGKHYDNDHDDDYDDDCGVGGGGAYIDDDDMMYDFITFFFNHFDVMCSLSS